VSKFLLASQTSYLLEAYWTIWSPNWPVIHRPGFDMASTPTTLLAALAVLGACHSPDLADRTNVRFWYDCVEEMVFNDPYITFADSNSNCMRGRHTSHKRQTVQAIQRHTLFVSIKIGMVARLQGRESVDNASTACFR